MIVAGIIGATGYAGAEIARLLSAHPNIERLVLASASFEGLPFSSVYPNFLGKLDSALLGAEAVIDTADVVFAALPNGVSEEYAALCAKKGTPFIDMSADFRFDEDADTYKAWYGAPYKNAGLHKTSVYGLCELNRLKIQDIGAGRGKVPVIIGNPGCYPTCASLAAWPALARGLAGPGTIIIDAASGVTGGGREPQRAFHFPEVYDSFSPYKVGAHRHTPEIARNFAVMSGAVSRGALPDSRHEFPHDIIFTPHLAPMNRGILATLYLPLAAAHRVGKGGGAPMPPSREVIEKTAGLRAVYADFYADERFIRVLDEGLPAATNRVRGSNYCDIGVHLDQSGSTLIVTAAIDNMVKGAAGQAVQNMNIIFDFDEAAGLGYQPALF